MINCEAYLFDYYQTQSRFFGSYFDTVYAGSYTYSLGGYSLGSSLF